MVSLVKTQQVVWALILTLILALAFAKAMALVLPHNERREYPLWCHNDRDMSLSGVCSKIKGLEWSI